MKRLNTLIAASALAIASASGAAWADGKASVQTLYDLLSNGGSEQHEAAFMDAFAENWESAGDYSGKNKNREGLAGMAAFLKKSVPDLKFEVQEMIEAGDSIIVRSRSTGTPNGPFFGVDGEGRSFDILAIDIHTLDGDKVVHSYHVEDWAGALQQLKGQ
ncbi:ester cyclase [Leisingera sp. ANG-Vp]|uniref:ester cyclase n=1 Tax=Leisingera sp. ANG-Vp TaxID=1577896 RepID=UPI00057C3B1B|nr:ester cyclase [Leisingera sp. ANG-Vp]KIC17519.1 polyketide cyclase [Leisingera sp. ANG-Vp]